jgi:hypothetical protein
MGERCLAQPYIGLGLEMGLGKTLTAMWAIFWSLDVRKWLVVAPPRVRDLVWPAEAVLWGAVPSGPARVYRGELIPAGVALITHRDFN